jgi:hypothetical protein
MVTVSDPQAARLVAAAEEHHATLRAGLTERTEAFVAAIAVNRPYEWERTELANFLRAELLPHADIEKDLIYAAAESEQTAILVDVMEDEHRMLTALVGEVEQAVTVTDAVIAAGALVVLFDVRVEQENRHLLPALAASGVDLSRLLSDRPEIIGDTSAAGST